MIENEVVAICGNPNGGMDWLVGTLTVIRLMGVVKVVDSVTRVEVTHSSQLQKSSKQHSISGS